MPEPQLAQPKHRLLLELGRGGMGTVYLAIAEGPAGFNKLKVVKQLRPDLASEPQFLQMFLEEARLAAQLNHPNVVQTFEVAFDGQRFYLEMEYLEGQSLDALGRRFRRLARPLPRAVGVWLLTQALAGLEYAHELKDMTGQPLTLVHRDVSPHNVFVTYDGAVKVLDFGIAKVAGSSVETRSGVVKGKATYMAPEQAARRTVDRRADVFAVGVMLWEQLAGRRFWAELSDAEIFLKLGTGSFESPRSVDPNIPEALDAICSRALAGEPANRFGTAGEMQIALEDWLASSGERTGPRQVATLMAELFAERRAAVRAEIEAHMARAATSPPTLVDVPMISIQNEPSHPTGSQPISPKMLAEFTARGSRGSEGFDPNASERTSAATPIGRGRHADVGQPATARQHEEASRTARGVTSEAPPSIESGRRAPRSGLRSALLAMGATGLVVGGGIFARSRATPAVAPIATSTSCHGNGECTRTNGGRPTMCVSGACVAIQTDSCRVVAEPGDAENDGTIWWGAMLPLTGPLADDLGRPTLHAIDVARQDFARISSGLPSSRQGQPTRPMAVVACDDAAGSAQALKHLVDELHVPGVIGFGSTKDLLSFAPSVLIPSKTMGVIAINQSPLIPSIPNAPGEPRMLWRTTYNLASAAEPIAAIISELVEPEMRAAPLNQTSVRVAVLRYSTGSAFVFSGDAFQRKLRFNGRGAAENGSDYREFSLGDPLSSDFGEHLHNLIPQITAFAPHVIVGFNTEALVRELLMPLVDRWPRSLPYHPYYLSSDLFDDKSSYQFFSEHPEWQSRFLSVNTPASIPANVGFTYRYDEDYAQPVTIFDAPGAGYDSFYLLAFAAYAVGDQPVTGADLGRAVRRLVPPGPTIDVGPANILRVLSILRTGGTVDLNGAATTLDFDLTNGDPTTDFAVYCPLRDAKAKACSSIESGVVYNAQSGHLAGKLHCPQTKER